MVTEPIRLDHNDEISEVNIRLSSTEIVSREERLIYTWKSFVAEFGGALGLFLGFSFIMLWDFLMFFFNGKICGF